MKEKAGAFAVMQNLGFFEFCRKYVIFIEVINLNKIKEECVLKKVLMLLSIIVFSMVAFAEPANASFLSGLFSLPTYTVSGKIVDSNQEPLEGILVSFDCNGIGGKKTVHTDSSGNYVLKLPAKTGGQLTVSGDGYRTKKASFGEYTSAGQAYAQNYTLYPDWISGKAVNQDGEPLQGIEISIEKDGGLNGVKTVYTDENGDYKAQIPADGVYYWLTASADGYSTIRDHVFLTGGYTYNLKMK
ncbi:MAG: carboxypeptidase-like regulatory domain-containing protein [Selenomonadaceae bacterium]